MSTANEKKKLVPKLDLNFSDYAIDTFAPSFEFTDEGGTYTKDKIIVSFNLKGSLKGLKLRCYKEGGKRFMLSYWHNKKSLTFPCGLFRKDVYGVKEVEEYLKPIVKACTNEHGYWETDPKKHLKELKKKEEREREAKRKIKTINNIIEMVCEENFPKTKVQGTLSQNQIRVNCLYLLGYNERTKHLIFTEDNEGNGLIRFTSEGPQSFTELFKQYPPGTGIIKYDPHLNPNKERSLYDSRLGETNIIDLIPGDVEDYVNKKSRSEGYRNNLLDTLSHLWSFARYHQSKPLGRTPPFNPCRRRDGGITIKKERKSKFKGSKYNEMSFSPKVLKKIENKLWDLVPRFDFRALALLMIMYSGKRQTETLKITTGDIDWVHKEINVRLPKSRKVEKVDFDPDILKVLDKIKELKKEKFGKINKKIFSIKSLQWLFPSSRIDVLKLHDDEYVKGEETRLKRLDTCMAVVKEELNIPGSMKTFRKAFDTNAIHEAKLSPEELSAVSGQSAEIIRRKYDKPGREIRKKLKEKIRLVKSRTN